MNSILGRALMGRGLPCLVGLCLLSAVGPSWADSPEIGAVRDIVAVAYGTPPGGDRRELALLEPVVSDQRLETVASGGLHVRFADETDLWLDADSDVVLDDVVFEPSAGPGTFVVELGPGLFRLVTGLMAHESYSIRTPAAVIGVRGTDFAVAVAENGSTRVTVFSGEVTIAPRGGGSATSVSTAETASVADANATVDVSTNAAPVAPPALSVDATADSASTVDALSVDAAADDSAASDAAAAATGDSTSATTGSVGEGFSADAASVAGQADAGGNATSSTTSVGTAGEGASSVGTSSDGGSTGDGADAGSAGSAGSGGGSAQ